jgi:hypothetical protein
MDANDPKVVVAAGCRVMGFQVAALSHLCVGPSALLSLSSLLSQAFGLGWYVVAPLALGVLPVRWLCL